MPILTPTTSPNDWRALLTDPQKQWREGKSAYELAHAWHAAQGFPAEVGDVLAKEPGLTGIEPLLILPEWKVALPGGGAASQTDVWVLAKCNAGLVSMAVEGKVDEPFGPSLEKWLENASPGKQKRLEYIAGLLGLQTPLPGELRYQLLHRTASAVIEAGRFGAAHAVMLVHSFSPDSAWFEDFAAFTALFGLSPHAGEISTARTGSGLPLSLAWVNQKPRAV